MRLVATYPLLIEATLLLWTTAASADEYYNCDVSEPSVNAATSTILFCDDLEDGTALAVTESFRDPANDGWVYSYFSGSDQNHVSADGAGANATKFTYQSTLSGGDGGGGRQYTHGWANGYTSDRFRFRFFIKFLEGYAWNGDTKLWSGQRAAHQAGIDLFWMRLGEGGTLKMCPVYDCATANGPDRLQNLGNAINFGGNTNKWFCLEGEIVLNTLGSANGEYRLWLNDCGPNGTACGPTQVLRAEHTNVEYRRSGVDQHTGNFGGSYLDLWGNPADVGTVQVDQIVVAKHSHGQIGCMGGGAIDTTPPAAPSGLMVR